MTAATEWSRVKLKAVGSVVTGSTPPTRDRSNYGREYMFVSPADLGRAKYVRATGKMLSAKGFARCRRIPAASTLFVCIGSTIGKIGLASKDLATNQQINSIIPNATVDPEFLYYATSTLSALVREQAGEQAVPLVNKSQFSEFEIPLPSLPEQRAISRVLMDTDSLIDRFERIIAKKQAIKQGMMQQLLTGRTRLPGFVGEWRESSLGRLAQVTGGGTPSTRVPSFWGGDIPWFTPAEIRSEGSGLVSHSARTITSEGLANSAASLLPAGTVLVTSRASIGHCAVAAVPAATNQGFTSMIPTDHRSTWFLYYWIQQNRSALESKAAGSTFLEVSASKVASILISEPSADEQAAIGAALRDIDLELGALQTRLAKAFAVKTGMLHQLLTGRTRLPREVAS